MIRRSAIFLNTNDVISVDDKRLRLETRNENKDTVNEVSVELTADTIKELITKLEFELKLLDKTK